MPAQPRVSSASSSRRLADLLRRVFGLRALRAGQREVIDRVMAGRSTLAIMPTGAGKSLCYQLPALMLDGCTVVVSPLIALMKDQCEKLRELGIAAVQLNSAIESDERTQAEAAVSDGTAKIVLTTPEHLTDPGFLALLQRHRVALLVVDEAHCISAWGHDFRPAFLEIETAVAALGRPTVLALTATAPPAAADDIAKRLGIPKNGIVNTGAWRPNLHYAVEQVSREKDKLDRVLALAQAQPGSGIVYAATVKAAEAVHEMLAGAGESVGLYHGHRGAADRRASQDAFMAGETRVMVATNAFGMGIDKADIRFVIHYQTPASLDAYYQESGRAGRDGDTAHCTLLFLRSDRAIQQFFMAGRYPDADDLDAVVKALRNAADDGASVAALHALTDRPRNKLQSGLALLRQQRIARLEQDSWRLVDTGVKPATLEALAQTYAARRSHDRNRLERMVFYAQTGRCRWRVLLDDLQAEAPAERCGTCDNCRRIADIEAAALRQPIMLPAEASGLSATAEPHRSATMPAFAPGFEVKVRRYGRGRVVAADAGSVTVEFSDGNQRCFQPDFVAAAR